MNYCQSVEIATGILVILTNSLKITNQTNKADSIFPKFGIIVVPSESVCKPLKLLNVVLTQDLLDV